MSTSYASPGSPFAGEPPSVILWLTQDQEGSLMGHILVLSGAGRYGDGIHDFDATSEAVSQILTERGHQVEVRRSEPEALDHLAGADLLIVNTGVAIRKKDGTTFRNGRVLITRSWNITRPANRSSGYIPRVTPSVTGTCGRPSLAVSGYWG